MEAGMAQVGGAKLYYEISGRGRPLVLLHAGGMDSRMWDEQFGPFAGHFKVIRYDARGLGKSEMPAGPFSHHEDLHDLLNSLGVGSASIVGLSLGGRTAVDFCLAYPRMVDALVLAGAGLSGYTFSPQYQEKIIEVISAVRDGTISRRLDAFLNNSPPAPSAERARAREKVIRMLTDNAKAFSSDPTLARELSPPAAGRLSEVRAPTLIVVGGGDDPDILTIAGILEAGIGGSRKVVLNGAGHLVNLEKPEEFNRVVLEFLGALRPPSAA